jgi:YD repeat-containing protein
MTKAITSGSSWVAGYEYDPHTKVLTVRRKDGGVTRYKGVQASVFQQLEKADSKGSFISSNIRGYYSEV